MDDLEDLYREIILDHYRSPRNKGELESPPAHRTEGFNPLCGDEIVLTVEVDAGVINDLKVDGHGCSISQSSASLMSGAVKGKSITDAKGVMRSFKRMMTVDEEDAGAADEPVDVRSLGELAALQGVVKFPVRIKCATLAWNTLAQALSELGV
ncbi:MAG TPA: SUF system NifU family Fe-S cluster assembly protein [Acidimicrobiales bacterium]|jgi:nitrogen fixation NifU-like protein